MKTKITVIYEPNDFKILKSHLNDAKNPCIECKANKFACCGCPEKRDWDENHKEIIDAGLENEWKLLRRYKESEDELNELNKQIQQIQVDRTQMRQELLLNGLFHVFDVVPYKN